MSVQSTSLGDHETPRVNSVCRQTYTVAEAANLLGIGRNTAFEAIHRGEIPALRIGKRLLVPKAAFDRMLAGEPS